MKVTLEDIKKAQSVIQGVVKETPIDLSISATKKIGSEIYLKFENQQITGSFKIRGAMNKISSLSEAEKKRGIIASSAGNHAQGVAYSATRAGVKSTIIMPVGAPLIKMNATRDYGANVILHGDIVDDAHVYAQELVKKEGYIFVHPYQDELIIAGQGTIGLEIMASVPDLDSVVVPIGGGGLISGIATAVKAINPKCKIYGVQSAQAPSMNDLFKTHTFVEEKRKISTIADGIAIKKPSQVMYDSFISKLVDDTATVTDDEIAEAIVFLLERAKNVTEGAGAAGMAAVLNKKFNLGKKTCVILGGGNIDLNIISKVIEKGQIRNGRLAELSVVVDDTPGNLNRLTKVIAEHGANILEVHHDRVNQGLFLRETRIDFVIETSSYEHVQQIREALTKVGGRIL